MEDLRKQINHISATFYHRVNRCQDMICVKILRHASAYATIHRQKWHPNFSSSSSF